MRRRTEHFFVVCLIVLILRHEILDNSERKNTTDYAESCCKGASINFNGSLCVGGGAGGMGGGGLQLYVVNTWSHCIRVLLQAVKKSCVSVFYCWCILFIIGCIWQSLRCSWRWWDKCERTLINSTSNKKTYRGRHPCTSIFVRTFTGITHYAAPHPNPSNPNPPPHFPAKSNLNLILISKLKASFNPQTVLSICVY